MVWLASPTTVRSVRPPSHASRRRCCNGLTSWYSSTVKCRYCARTWSATSGWSSTAHTEAGQPGAQLGGGAGGERDGEHVPGGDLPGQYPVGDAVGDRPGFPGTRAGQDADWTRRGGHRRPLLVVEPGQNPFDRVARHS